MRNTPINPDPDSEDIAERLADMLDSEGDVHHCASVEADDSSGGHQFEVTLHDGKGRFLVRVIPPEGGSVL